LKRVRRAEGGGEGVWMRTAVNGEVVVKSWYEVILATPSVPSSSVAASRINPPSPEIKHPWPATGEKIQANEQECEPILDLSFALRDLGGRARALSRSGRSIRGREQQAKTLLHPAPVISFHSQGLEHLVSAQIPSPLSRDGKQVLPDAVTGLVLALFTITLPTTDEKSRIPFRAQDIICFFSFR
jgi:hypothetical protein